MCQAAEAGASGRTEYANLRPLDHTEDEPDSGSQIMDTSVQSNGTESILKITNFTVEKICCLLNDCEKYLPTRWNKGCGLLNTVFVILTVFINGGTWDFLDAVFNMKC